MTADERVDAMASERLADVHGGEIALVGEDNPYFRAIRKVGAKFGILERLANKQKERKAK